MNDITAKIYQYLDELGIAYRVIEHAPSAMMTECASVDATVGALTPKNLFLTTKSGKRLYLCLTRPNARFHTADISKQAGSPRLSFAEGEKLYDALRCRPGAASPLGLIFDAEHRVGLLVDRALTEVPTLGFHPCDNTLTVYMAGADFLEKFLPAVDVSPQWVEIHDFL